MHTDERFIEKSKKRKNFVVSGNSSYFACDCLYLIGRIRLICNISLSAEAARGSGVLGRVGAFLDGPGGLGAGPPSAGAPSPKAEPEDLST